MHPLMFIDLVPDSHQVSRDAAQRHAILSARRAGGYPRRPAPGRWRLFPQS
ncbi:hypothetical protein ACPW96_02470 [Micromonospora sp. DT81.3]|uniref:hypothetical protein n=1 Tax=Actinomycetes TaxID=1760 RepID=UPI003CEA331E